MAKNRLPVRRIYHAQVMAGNKARTFNYPSIGKKGSDLNMQHMAEYYEKSYKEPWTDDIVILEVRCV